MGKCQRLIFFLLGWGGPRRAQFPPEEDIVVSVEGDDDGATVNVVVGVGDSVRVAVGERVEVDVGGGVADGVGVAVTTTPPPVAHCSAVSPDNRRVSPVSRDVAVP